jgi:uncharacterized membrane protein
MHASDGGTMRIPGVGKPIDPPRPSERRKLPEDRLARLLGWFSFGVGLPQVVAPSAVNRVLGIRDEPRTRLCQRIVGARELATAAGIFSQPRPALWLWSRAGGDAADLALLARGLRNAESPIRTLGAIGAVATITGADLLATRRAKAAGYAARTVVASTTVRAAPEAAYGLWHDLHNMPRFLAYVESVEVMDGRSHWRAAGPTGRRIEWDAEIVDDRPNELISWRSSAGAPVPSSGSVRFASAPGDRGTEVRMLLHLEPPATLLGNGPFRGQAEYALRRFKQVLEAGEIVRSEANPGGPLPGRMLRQRPAQPPPAGGDGS